ncbi:hypothetical protein BJX64DRAFT_266021, partial [Aspergillus heterothallicus]
MVRGRRIGLDEAAPGRYVAILGVGCSRRWCTRRRRAWSSGRLSRYRRQDEAGIYVTFTVWLSYENDDIPLF